ncbi:MAG: right-handed parallel beta-helix repeat-containing protein, partial [Candidatus Kariarchaeaceae archaeon]
MDVYIISLRTFGLLIICILGIIPISATTMNPYSGSGDWILTQGETISDQDFDITGDLILQSEDRISFSNCEIIIDGTLLLDLGSHSFFNNSILSTKGKVIVINSGSHANHFENNTIKGTVNTAIDVTTSDNNKFVNNTIENLGLASYGFYIYNSIDTNLINNSIKTSGIYGLYLLSSNSSIVSGNIISGGIQQDSYALYEKNSGNNVFTENIIYSNYTIPVIISFAKQSSYISNTIYTNITNGMSITNSENILVENNLLESRYGIYVYAGLYHTYRGNSINTINNSLMVNYLHNSSFINNNISTENTGFEFTGSNFNSLTENIGHKADTFATFERSNYNTLSKNQVEQTNYGIVLQNSNYNTINSSKLVDTSKGIQFRGSVRNRLFHNEITSIEGIILTTSTSNVVSNNSIRTQKDTVLLTSSSGNNNISDNVLYSEASDAIYLSTVQINRITNNTIKSSKGNGIHVQRAENWYKKNIIEQNTISSDTGYGVFLESYSNHGVTIYNNTITSNTTAVHLWRAHYNDFRYNRIDGKTTGITIDDLSHGNEFYGNTIQSNGTALLLE